MTASKQFNKCFLLALIGSFLFLAACESDNIYHKNEEPRLPKEKYFDFSTSSEVTLSINYGYTGYSVLFSLYLENPIGEDGWKENLAPYYSAYTDQNSTFSGKITLPTNVKFVYLSSAGIGTPSNLKLDVINNSITYNYSQPSKIKTRTAESPSDECIDIAGHTNTLNSGNKLHALYNRFQPDFNSSLHTLWEPWNNSVNKLYEILQPTVQLTAESYLGQLLGRINDHLVKTDNTNLIVETNEVNLKIAAKTPKGNDVEKAHIDLIFLRASGSYHNAMGYYYYKTGETPTAEEVKQLPKFIVFPRTTNNYPTKIIKARLQFYGESYDTTVGTDDFPPGYTIGFVLVADIANKRITGRSLDWYANINTINDNINAAIQFPNSRAIYSNNIANPSQRPGCIALLDKASERIVIGFEDQIFLNSWGDKSMEDILFYVKANPFEAVIDIDNPKIPDLIIDGGANAKPVPEKLVTDSIEGTLAFEDIWPYGGDYDMNDVIIEYKTKYTFNSKNRITKIVDSFTFVHDGASFTNAFGYIIDGQVGTIDTNNSNYATQEENNQFIFTADCGAAVGSTYKLTRTFEGFGAPSITNFVKGYNPFIVPNYQAGAKNRTEVHLPKYATSTWANTSLNNTVDDAYYINKSGKYPFAIDLTNVKNFQVVTESTRIGSDGEYPDFTKWAESNGTLYTDWYKRKSN